MKYTHPIIISILLSFLLVTLELKWLPTLEEYVHLLHQPYTLSYAALLTLVFLIPLIEEYIKLSFADLRLYRNEFYQLIHILFIGYTFQVAEAFYYSDKESTWYFRLILPMHILFTLATVRFNFWFGVLLHSMWNLQFFLNHEYFSLQVVYLIFFTIFGLLLYIDRINAVILVRKELIDNPFLINNEQISKQS